MHDAEAKGFRAPESTEKTCLSDLVVAARLSGMKDRREVLREANAHLKKVGLSPGIYRIAEGNRFVNPELSYAELLAGPHSLERPGTLYDYESNADFESAVRRLLVRTLHRHRDDIRQARKGT